MGQTQGSAWSVPLEAVQELFQLLEAPHPWLKGPITCLLSALPELHHR